MVIDKAHAWLHDYSHKAFDRALSNLGPLQVPRKMILDDAQLVTDGFMDEGFSQLKSWLSKEPQEGSPWPCNVAWSILQFLLQE